MPSLQPSKSARPSSMPSSGPSESAQPSLQPSNRQQLSLSSEPSSLPSSSLPPSKPPSKKPTPVTQNVTNNGSLSVSINICALDGNQRDAFVVASIATTSNWQMEYEVTKTLTCAVVSCDSLADLAAVSSVSNSVTALLSSAMSSGSFLTLLSTNLVQSSELDPSIVSCLVVWGLTEDAVVANGEMGTGRFYPDWIFQSGMCLDDGNEPTHMANDESWLLDSLEECCERYFSWNTNACMNVKGSGLWYADVFNN
eukprot:scaffold162249_cov20-Cyclotella_meneghiniana.AAC.1